MVVTQSFSMSKHKVPQRRFNLLNGLIEKMPLINLCEFCHLCSKNFVELCVPTTNKQRNTI